VDQTGFSTMIFWKGTFASVDCIGYFIEIELHVSLYLDVSFWTCELIFT